MKLLKNICAVLLMGWFGITCFKLGWYAGDNFLIRSFASSVLGLEARKQNQPQEGLLENWQVIFEEGKENK